MSTQILYKSIGEKEDPDPLNILENQNNIEYVHSSLNVEYDYIIYEGEECITYNKDTGIVSIKKCTLTYTYTIYYLYTGSKKVTKQYDCIVKKNPDVGLYLEIKR
jgi:hypothetical protein